MAVRVRQMARIQPEFLDFCQEVAVDRLKYYLKQIKNTADPVAYYQKNKHLIASLTPIAEGVSGVGKGMDFLKTRLRALPFYSVELITLPQREGDREYILVQTKDITVVKVGRSRRQYADKYDAGSYCIYVPVKSFMTFSMAGTHWIPDRNRWAAHRTPHHYASSDRAGKTHPVQLIINTCLGDMSGTMQKAMYEGDMPEFLRTLYIFLVRFNAGSPLTGIRNVMEDARWTVL